MTVKVAAEKLRQQILEVTAGQLEANIDDLEIREGRVQVKGTPDRGMTFSDVYKVASMSQGGHRRRRPPRPCKARRCNTPCRSLRLRSIQTLARSRWWT